MESAMESVRSKARALSGSALDSVRSAVRTIAGFCPSGRSVVRRLSGSCPSFSAGSSRCYTVALIALLLLSLSCLLLVSNSAQTGLDRFVPPAFKRAKAPPPPPPWTDPGPFHVAYPGDYRFIMDDTDVCRASKPFVVLMVPVAPNQVDRRNVIRGSWGRRTEVNGRLLQTLFFLGVAKAEGGGAEQLQEKLRQENEEHHDLIQSDFIDSYHNLTIKTMMMIEWLTAHCSAAATYAVKIDSDVFLHVPNLLSLLENPLTPRVGYMSGLVWWHSPVIRSPGYKFFMPRWVIPEDEYPPYPLGMIYILSLDLPRQLLRASQDIRPIHIEDAYLGLCLRRLRLQPTDPPRADLFLVEPGHPLSDCALSRLIATVTDSPARMMSYWGRSRDPDTTHC